MIHGRKPCPGLFRTAVAMAISAALAACGGGGGSKSGGGSPVVANPVTPSTPTTPSTPAAPPSSPPINIQLTATHVTEAQAQGVTGKGVSIGIVDTGVMHNHPSLDGRVVGQAQFVDGANNLSMDDVAGRGTALAQIAAGRPLGQFPGGIAPDASIFSIRAISDDLKAGNAPAASSSIQDMMLLQLNRGVKISNHSWGGAYWSETDQATTQRYHDAFALFASSGLVVFAAGDESKDRPNDLAALPSRAADIKNWLVVVALDSNAPDKLASYTNRCGDAWRYCLAAPGDVVTNGLNDVAGNVTYKTWSGSGFAAAQVSGAAAALMQVFPDFNGDAIKQIVLGTTDDVLPLGRDGGTGYGRLNLAQAVKGPRWLDWDVFPATLNGHDISFSNDISGQGRLDVSGSGKLTLFGEAGNLGGLSARGSALTVEAMRNIAGRVSLVGANLVAHGNIGGNVMNMGVLQTLNDPIHVGSYQQTTYGTLATKLGAPLTVHGSAELAGNLRIDGATPGYVTTSHQTILSATGGVTGQFERVSLAQGVFVSASPQYADNEVWLDTTSLKISQVAAQSMPSSSAAMASAARLDQAFGQLDAISSSSGAAVPSATTLVAAGLIQQSSSVTQAQKSLESLSGELHAASAAMTFAGIDAGNDAFAVHALDAGKGVWAQSLGYQGNLGRGGFGSVGVALNGHVAGRDFLLGRQGFMGFAVGQWQSMGVLGDLGDRRRSRASESMIYGGVRGDRWYGVARVAIGNYREQMQRNLQFGSTVASVGSRADGRYVVSYGEAGYRMQTGGLAWMPFASLENDRIRRSAFDEQGGAGFGLRANAVTTSRWQTALGLRALHAWTIANGGEYRLSAKIAWQHAFGLRGEVFQARYTGLDAWGAVKGIGLSRDGGLVNIGFAWAPNANVALGVDIDQRAADRSHSFSANTNLRIAW